MQHVKTVMDAGHLCYKYYKTPVKKSGNNATTTDEVYKEVDEGVVNSLFKPDVVIVHLPNAILLVILLIAVISFLWLWWRWT